MSEPVSISSGIAERYAVAAFDLARDGGDIELLAADIDALAVALQVSDDFAELIHSPIYTRSQQGDAVAAIAKKMKLSATVTNLLRLMASNRRLFVLPQLLALIRSLIAEDKGEVTADVTAASAMSKAQQEKLASSLKKSIGKDVKINMAVDEKLIGGLIVKVGSKMIDTSIASKLANLQNAMKEVG